MREKIKTLIISSLNELKETNGMAFELKEDSVLLGENAIMDSFDFVTFIANVEEKIADEFNKSIVIVSEKAFSKKYSPFKTVDRIVDYIIELLNEAE